MSKESYL